MRFSYRGIRVASNYENMYPNGTDVIGVGHVAPTNEHITRLWFEITNKYATEPRVIFGLMNEPHHVPFATLTNYHNLAIAAIRDREKALGVAPHLVLVAGNNWSRPSEWFSKNENDTYMNANDALFLDQIKDTANHYAVEINIFFDTDESGRYGTAECKTLAEHRITFDPVWSRF